MVAQKMGIVGVVLSTHRLFFFKTTVLNLLTSEREKISMPSSPNTMMLTAYATFELYTNTSKPNKNM